MPNPTSHMRPGISFKRDERSTWCCEETTSPRMSQSLLTAWAACMINKIVKLLKQPNIPFSLRCKGKLQIVKLSCTYLSLGVNIRKIISTFCFRDHEDDIIPPLISSTISPKYNWRVTRSLLIFSSHISSYRLETDFSSSNLHKII